ncbi:TrbC family F-type conjugative pilus assembly protein [Aquamicrobium sp.]|uniref:TrbC family F-type conjugative pilus assembly protein n=1 Tax=Aquamicrobium sp. TaxID=1872579 RepID=UPI002589B731|nr:TrbC family F-type conjugative pilus assembly protein [Aquamicrobium sp.]MCK9549462.1 TrbC family F-type conjugative pilus assembly protein [Aquamicrobium sp.]
MKRKFLIFSLLCIFNTNVFAKEFNRVDFLLRNLDSLSPVYKSFGGYTSNVILKQKVSNVSMIYFFSASVSPAQFSNFIKQVEFFNRTHPKMQISSKQVLIGMHEDMGNYMRAVEKILKKSPYYANTMKLIDVQMAPELYEMYKVKQAPAMALSLCKGNCHASDCKVVIIGRGSFSLDYFLRQSVERKIITRAWL